MFIKVLLICFGIIPSLLASQEVITKDELRETKKDISKEQIDNGLADVVKKSSDAVVLIHTISDSAEDDGLIYNSAMKKRLKKQDYKHGVISGVLISADGIVCTTGSGVANSDRIIVSIRSESRVASKNDKASLGEDDYEARVLKIIPELNLAFLKITPKKGKEFAYIELGNDAPLVNKDGVLLNSSVVIGKAKGENFVTPAVPANSNNAFSIIANGIEKLSYTKLQGTPVLLIENTITNSAILPENEGGALLGKDGKLLGIAFINNEDFSVPNSAAIPVSVIKKAINATIPQALPHSSNKSSVGIKPVMFEFTLPDSLKETLDIKSEVNSVVKVGSIEIDSAADKAGIKAGDVILKFNDEFASDIETYENLEKAAWGDQTVTLKILRDDKLLDVEINK